MKINLPILYSQMDDRWAKIILGFNSDPQFNFYNYACLITSLAMICRYFGKEVDPIIINDKLKSVNGYAKGSGNYVWGSINKIFGDIKENKVDTPSLLTDTQVGEIKSSLDNGYPVMVGLDYNPKDVDFDSHYVLIVGYNPSDENDFTIADPLGGKLRSLKDYLGWFKPTARKTIERYLTFTGPKPKVTSDTVVLSKDDADRRTHGNEQWIKLLGYLGITTDPFITLFEDAQKVIAGFKSRSSDLETQLANSKIDLEKANTEVSNQKDKLANIQDDCQNALKLKDAEIKALSEASKDITKLRGEYQATIDNVQGKLREAQKLNGIKDLEITDLKTQIELLKKGVKVDKKIVILNLLKFIYTKFMEGFKKK